MKPKPNPPRREIFVLTPEEKKTVCFVLFAIVLGLATKHYRDTHSPPISNTEIRDDGKALPASRFSPNSCSDA